jgi:hypothetical protein
MAKCRPARGRLLEKLTLRKPRIGSIIGGRLRNQAEVLTEWIAGPAHPLSARSLPAGHLPESYASFAC